jgi:ribonuclease P protein subunit RPR2
MDNRRKKVIKSSVRSSITDLVLMAQKTYSSKNAVRSSRYIKMALDLIKKHKVRLPKELKNSFCKKCCIVWIPGKTINVTYDKKNECLRIKCKCGYSKRL